MKQFFTVAILSFLLINCSNSTADKNIDDPKNTAAAIQKTQTGSILTTENCGMVGAISNEKNGMLHPSFNRI
jgi:PBP1b-binding outer membrane lipoprotein LpoB